ncbi:MAG: TonB-dependent receptor [Acidobacteriota bacterium]
MRHRSVIGALALLALLVATSAAQEFRATITGLVTDQSGAAVPGVAVQVRNVDTNAVATAVTDGAGNYTAPFLRPGSYAVTIEAAGFKKFVREGLTLNVGQTAAINIQLEVGQVSEQVTVTAETPLLETAKADRGQVIDSQRVREFPLNQRNPFMLAILSAGVNFNGNIIYQRPFDNGAIADWNISGGLNRNNEFLLDGAPNNAQAGNNNIALVPPVDSVEEFKIQTNSYDAQYGKSAGGIVNVSLKSGTNSFHGTLYEFARRNAWDANSFQNNARGADKTEHFLDQYGGAVGGPIVVPKLYNGKDKSFFFFNYEGYREGTPTPLNLSVPAPEFLDGDFSNLKTAQNQLIAIYDPTTGRDVSGTWTRTAFPGNRIPAARLNPIAKKILGYSAKPNTTTPGAAFYSQQNRFVPGGDNLDADDFYNMVIKFDQNISQMHHLFFRHASNDRTEMRNTNGVIGPGEDGPAPLKRVNDAYVIDWVGTITPTFIANARVSWNRYIEGSAGWGNRGFSPAQLGFPASLINQLPIPDWFGRYEWDNYQALGRYYGFNYTNNFAIHPTLTKIRGSHSIKTGLDFRTIVYNQQRPGNPWRFTNSKAYTQKEYNRADALSGNSIATFLLGTPTGGNIDYNVNPATVQRYYAPYIQDDWKLTRKLTVNLGFRMDFNTPPFERHDRLNRSFDAKAPNPVDKLIDRTKFPGYPAVTGQLLFANVGGVPRRAADLDTATFQPRAGFAYSATQKLVLRGGWGRYYMNPNNDYLQFNGYDRTTSLIPSLDGGRTNLSNLLNNPFPNGVEIPTGSSLGALTFLGRGFSFFDPAFKVPYVNQFSFGFQYELPLRSAIEVSYAGNRAHKLETNWQYNEPNLEWRTKCYPLEGGNPSYCDALVPNPFYNLEPFAGTGSGTSPTVSRNSLARPYPAFGSLTQRGRNDGKAWYNSMQVTYQLRGIGGLNLNLAYTLSKMIEQGRNFTDGSGNNSFLDNQRMIIQRGIYQFDRPHVVKIGSVWELPFGKGKRLFNTPHSLWSRLASGWQHTLIFTYSSGPPWDLPGGVRYLKEAKLEADWSASQIRGVKPCVARYNTDGSITPQAFSVAYGCGSDVSAYNFLILPRYAPRETSFRDGRVRLHAAPQFDMSINKTTQIKEGLSVQFRAEAFNIMNTFYFPKGQFDNNPESTNFGSMIKGTVSQGNANFPRQVQFAVKFIF